MILPRYFIRETIKIAAAIVGGLLVLYLTMRLAAALGDAAEGKIAPQHIVRMVGLKMLVSLKDLLPMSLFLGTFAAATRLQLGSEWVVMRAAGMSHQHLLKPLAGLALATAAVVALITLVVGPQAEHYLRELKEITENEATIAGVKAGRFRDLAGGRRVFYAESIADDQKHLERAFVHSRDKKADNGREGALRSDRAAIETDRRSHGRFAVFERGSSYAGEPGQADYTITDFTRYGVRIEDPEPTNFNDHIAFVLTTDLLKHDEFYYAVEFQSRFNLPLCTLLTPALAFLIGVGNRRGHWYLGLMAAVAGYFAYTNLLGVGRALLLKGVIPHQLGVWPVHLLFMLALGLLLAWHRRRLRLPPLVRPRRATA
ncbi:MAG: LPS export ABC transporter permease LptF [Gammaproteobacteria bacterium]|nr:LPS export ABC transporter permease LptF [Gammaproteobacteria bacterium]